MAPVVPMLVVINPLINAPTYPPAPISGLTVQSGSSIQLSDVSPKRTVAQPIVLSHGDSTGDLLKRAISSAISPTIKK